MTVKITERKQGGWVADIRIRLPTRVMYRERVKVPVSSRSAAARWAEAREREIIINGPRKEPPPPEKPAPTFNGFVARFLEHAENNNKPSTAYAKRRMLANHLQPVFGEQLLADISVQDVEHYKAAKVDAGLAKKTVNNHLITLRKLLRLAQEWGELDKVPAVKEFRLEDPEFQFLDFGEAERLLAAATPVWHSMMLVALKTGLRAGELRALRWSDVDLTVGLVVVRRTLWRGREGLPKGGRTREVPLCDSAIEALKAHRHLRHLKGGRVWTRDEAGTALAETDIQGVVADTCRRAGLSKVLSWHELRHTFASHLVMRGVPLKAVQELLGHATMEMTMRYAHLSPDVRRDAVCVLDTSAGVGKNVARSVP